MTRGMWFAVAALMLLASCRSVTAPHVPARSSAPEAPQPSSFRDDAARGSARPVALAASESDAQVPIVVRCESVSDARGMHFRLHLAPGQPGAEPFYGPRVPGGWQFQLFLDADHDAATGYWLGFDYLTRDSEADLDDGTLVVRRTEGGGGPGGWGDAVSRIPVRVNPRLVMFTIPPALVDGDGIARFTIEFYATVSGGDDGATPVARFVRDYAGAAYPRLHRGQPPSGPSTAASGIGGGGGLDASPALDRLVTR